jgi:hypothetical protein
MVQGKYFVDVGVGGEEGAGVSFADDNVDYAGWETGFFEEFPEEDCRETVTFGWFCDDGVSGGQCWCHFICEEHHWDIERGNSHTNSQRLMFHNLLSISLLEWNLPSCIHRHHP